MSIDKLAARYPVRFRHVFFPLHPETPAAGRPLQELFGNRNLEPAQARMKALMAEAGLPWGNRTHTWNSRLAQELGKWADTQPGGAVLHGHIFRACFVDNVNLARSDELLKLADAAGLDPVAAQQVLATRSFSAAVDADWQRAREMGISGVPTLLADDLVVVGCQPCETLERFIKHLLERRPAPPSRH